MLFRSRQYRSDNDYIGYLLSGDTLGQRIKFETGYMTQVPGTDSTTMDAYISGTLGESVVKAINSMKNWYILY